LYDDRAVSEQQWVGRPRKTTIAAVQGERRLIFEWCQGDAVDEFADSAKAVATAARGPRGGIGLSRGIVCASAQSGVSQCREQTHDLHPSGGFHGESPRCFFGVSYQDKGIFL
jgi:hypothetical protein